MLHRKIYKINPSNYIIGREISPIAIKQVEMSRGLEGEHSG